MDAGSAYAAYNGTPDANCTLRSQGEPPRFPDHSTSMHSCRLRGKRSYSQSVPYRPALDVRNLIMADRNPYVPGHSIWPHQSAATALARPGALVIACQFHHEVKKSAGLCRHVVPGRVVDV